MQGNNPIKITNAELNRIKIDHGSLRSDPPDAPGVYMFKDSSGRVIYVGKAKNLKKRVLSYFKSGPDIPPKTTIMIKNARGLDYTITTTENEAFILESSLIKGYMPKYNVILRDDKQYPCLRLDIKELYPRLNIVRKIKKDGAIYFGPFSSSYSVTNTLRLIDRIFLLRKCKTEIFSKKKRPCLNFQMGRCLGPCAYDVPLSYYKDIVTQVRLFLDGRNNELIKDLEREMSYLSDKEDFEAAARVRDQIIGIKRTIERQNVVSSDLEDHDVIGLAYKEDRYQLVIQFIRKGYLKGSRNYSFNDITATPSEVIESFLKQYYSQSIFFPKNILISEPIEAIISFEEWISSIAGKKIKISKPIRGSKLRIMNMAVSNARDALLQTERHSKEDLMELTEISLRLKKKPERIECMDISNLQGGLAVGTVVSFLNGLPFKDGYRNYRIKEIDGINDYGMMSELVARHLKGERPVDLIVLDGGKGHLMAVNNVLERLGLKEPPEMISIAKADKKKGEKVDKIFLKGRKNPLILKIDHPVLLLLMRMRDEAHRRAVSYHRKLRSNEIGKSQLNLIPGIGLNRKRQLLRNFGDINAISMSSTEELALIKGISRSMAQAIHEFFTNKENKPE